MLLILLGTYAYETYTAHVVMVIVLALFAYWLQKIDVPVVPIVLGFVMGPIIEENLSRALTIHSGDVLALVSRPISLVILIAAAVTALYSMTSGRRAEPAEAGSGG